MSSSALFDLIDNAGASTWLTAGAATLATIAAYKALSDPANVDVIKSPFSTQLPHLSSTELNALPYPPDVLPGARDVESPYGTIRVFEWGPEKGRKVLLVHGISTPCLSLAGVAVKLVERGCRVMLFDLFGRGYSDAPQNLKHDAGLYTTQILLCLASSPLSWTGTNAFSLVGYSLGGGISAAFTSYLPHLVESLILIAPSGLIRQEHIGWSSRILYQTEGILPEAFIHWLVRRRLMAGPIVAAKKKADGKDLSPTDALAAETGGNIPSPTEERGPHQPRPRSASMSGDGSAPIFAHKPQVTVPASVQWQILNHDGFISAFTSAIRHAPITRCHPLWRKIGTRLTQQKVNSADQRTQNHGLWRSKVLLILGRDDPIIIKDEIEQDATEALGGKNNVEIVVIAAGHELPVNKSRDVTDAILRYWGEDVHDDDTVEVEEDLGT